MKKYFKLATLIIVLCMCFAIIGCFGSKPKEEPKQQNQANTTQTTTTNATTKEENTNTTSNQNQISFDSLNSEYSERRNEGMRTGCRANLKNIGTACEMYAADHEGRYPTNLDIIIQDHYMKIMPVCPFNQERYEFESTEKPDFYSVKCKHHQMIFDSKIGLTDPNPPKVTIRYISLSDYDRLPNYKKVGIKTACKSNLKNIGTACEFYACDHNGRYPTNLDLLKSENYMKILPKCLIEGTEYKFVSKFIKIDDNHAIDYYIIKCNCPKHELIFESNIGLLDAENLDGYPSVKEYYNSLKNGKIKMTDGQEIILTDDDLKELGFK